MTEEQNERILADCLEDFHRQRARGEKPSMSAFAGRLGDLNGEFLELVAAETAIDEALDPAAEAPLPLAWGKYTILREIARGAAGVVYEALHRELGRKVALKVLRTGLDTDDTTRERFRREAQALAQVHHDHIVEIYEFGEVDGRPYYAMSLVKGPTLAQLVKADARPSPQELCRGLAGVADALQLLHDAGIIHRDVKPSNIMIAENGRYMLADFGLARTAMSATMTRTGDALGTPLYMSPEQMLGSRDAIESRTDIYSLGATMYQLLTGKPPFKTENLHALMRMVLSQRPEPARSVAPELPSGCSRIAMKCLEKEPRDRYSSARDMQEDLLAFADGRPVAGKPLKTWQRFARQVQRHPAYSAAAAVILTLGVFLATRPPPPPPAAHLTVKTDVLADVRLGDELASHATPLLKYPLPHPGEYALHIHPRDRDFLDETITISAAAGEHVILPNLPLEPRDPNSEKALEAARRFHGGMAAPVLEKPEQDRGPPHDTAIELAFPRGRVRLADVHRWQVMVGFDFPLDGGGTLEFLSAGQIVGKVPLETNDPGPASNELSAAILEKLRPGMHLSWQFRAKGGKVMGLPARFEIVESSVDADLAAVDRSAEDKAKGIGGWKNKGARRSVAATLRAEILMNHGLYTAAFREIQPLVESEQAGMHQIALQMSCLQQLLSADKATRRAYKRWGLWGDMSAVRGRFTAEQWKVFWAQQESR